MFKNRPYLKIIFLLGIIIFILGAIRFYPKSPLLERYLFSKSFFAKDGTLLRVNVTHDEKYRVFVPLNEIPQEFKDAVILYEDKYFYRHLGVNPLALFRAFWVTFVSKSRRVGASTITMQTARILYNINTKNLIGKLKQILLSLWLEIGFSKNEILETYLNLAPYGYNIEGAEAASLVYFHKQLKDLELLETLTLAVIPQNPNQRRPSTNTGFERMKKAREILLNNWVKKHPQDKEKIHFFNLPMKVFSPKNLPFDTPHLVNYLNSRTSKNLIQTTIDLGLQKKFEKYISEYIKKRRLLGINNTAVMLLNADTMEPEVYVGSADFGNFGLLGQVNGITAKRMAGSILKPFIYGMAIDKGLIHPMSLLKDTQQFFSIYTPENSDRQFSGPILAVNALINSRNIPAISLLQQVGVQEFLDLLKKSEVKNIKSAKHYGASAAVGSVDVSIEELAKLYASILNDGYVSDIKYMAGDNYSSEKIPLISPEAAFLLFDMLSTNPPPRKTNIKDKNGEFVKVAWKTGTSFSYKDAWAAGVFGKYVLVVWVGNFSGKGNPNFWGRTAAGNLFFDLVNLTVKDKKNMFFYPPTSEGLNVKKVPICESTGDLPGKYCPKTTEGYFIPGKSPIKISDIHRPVLINKKTGLRACSIKDGETYEKIYEFWPSDIQALFQQAGIKKEQPPNFMPGCEIEELVGVAPKIILPIQGVAYIISPGENKIPLKAVVDGDVKRVFWFVDSNYVGETIKNESLFITLSDSVHNIQAIDDLGRKSYSSVLVNYR